MAIVNSQIAGTPDDTVKVLSASNAQLGTTAAVATTIKTYTLPGGLMGPNDSLRIITLWTFLNNANAKTAFITFGGTSNFILNETLVSAGVSMQTMQIIRNNNSTSAQKSYSSFRELVFEKSTAALETDAVDTTADVDIEFRALSDGTDNVYLESYSIELIRGV